VFIGPYPVLAQFKQNRWANRNSEVMRGETSRRLYCRIWQAAVGSVAIAAAVACGTLCLGESEPPGNKKGVGVTLLNIQFSFVAAVGDAMKAQAAKEGVGLT
jgi:hypothetical protein